MILIRFFVLTALSILVGAFVSFGARDALAQSAACDSDFETVLNARATLEAMREVEIAQTLILKPDSVLEYSCFDDRLNELAAAADTMFSDNIFSSDLFNVPAIHYNPSGPYAAYLPTINATTVTPPGSVLGSNLTGPNPPLNPPGRLFNSGLNNALSNVVYATMFQYLLNNFSHLYAGGTFSAVPTTPGVCNPMDLVWQFVKCTDFQPGLFRTFGELSLSIGDPRLVPSPCNDPNRSARWTTALTAAYPVPGALGGVEILATAPSANVYSHTVQLFNTSACSSLTPVPTGVRVYQGAPPSDVYADHVCPAAGCYYDGAAGTCN